MKQSTAICLIFGLFLQFYTGHLLPLDDLKSSEQPIVEASSTIENKTSTICKPENLNTTSNVTEPIALPSLSQKLQNADFNNSQKPLETEVSNSTEPSIEKDTKTITATTDNVQKDEDVTAPLKLTVNNSETVISIESGNSSSEFPQIVENENITSAQSSQVIESITLSSRNRRELTTESITTTLNQNSTTELGNKTISEGQSNSTVETSTSYHPVYFLGISG